MPPAPRPPVAPAVPVLPPAWPPPVPRPAVPPAAVPPEPPLPPAPELPFPPWPVFPACPALPAPPRAEVAARSSTLARQLAPLAALARVAARLERRCRHRAGDRPIVRAPGQVIDAEDRRRRRIVVVAEPLDAAGAVDAHVSGAVDVAAAGVEDLVAAVGAGDAPLRTRDPDRVGARRSVAAAPFVPEEVVVSVAIVHVRAFAPSGLERVPQHRRRLVGRVGGERQPRGVEPREPELRQRLVLAVAASPRRPEVPRRVDDRSRVDGRELVCAVVGRVVHDHPRVGQLVTGRGRIERRRRVEPDDTGRVGRRHAAERVIDVVPVLVMDDVGRPDALIAAGRVGRRPGGDRQPQPRRRPGEAVGRGGAGAARRTEEELAVRFDDARGIVGGVDAAGLRARRRAGNAGDQRRSENQGSERARHGATAVCSPFSVGVTGTIVPSLLNDIRSMQVSRCVPSPPGILKR